MSYKYSGSNDETYREHATAQENPNFSSDW